jgi:hypothetical protein
MWALENVAAPKPAKACPAQARLKLTFACIGRAGRGPERDLYEHYAGRIRWSLTLRELDEKKKLPPPSWCAAKASCCWRGPDKAVLVALDRRGKVLDSAAFADRLARWARRRRSGHRLPDRRRQRPRRAASAARRPRAVVSVP